MSKKQGSGYIPYLFLFVVIFALIASAQRPNYTGNFKVTGTVEGDNLAATGTVTAATFVFSASNMIVDVGNMTSDNHGQALIIDVSQQTIAPGDITVTNLNDIGDVSAGAPGLGQILGFAADGTWQATDTVAAIGAATNTVIMTMSVSPVAGIAAGAPVYINGSTDSYPTVSLAQNGGSGEVRKPIGFAMETKAQYQTIQVAVSGLITGISTSAFSPGDPVYLSNTAGQITASKPSAPGENEAILGWVRTSGSIYVLPRPSLDMIAGVSAEMVQNQDFLRFSASEHTWAATQVPGLDRANTFTVAGSIVGNPATGQIVIFVPFIDSVDFASDFSGSSMVLNTAPTNDATFTFYNNTSVVATALFASGVTEAVFTTTGTVSYTPGQVFKVEAPNPQDDTLDTTGIMLRGTVQ